MALSQSSNVKVQISDEAIYTWAYKNSALYNTPVKELYQKFIDQYKDKDGYINAPLYDVLKFGNNIRGDFLINEGDLQAQQTKSPEPEREM